MYFMKVHCSRHALWNEFGYCDRMCRMTQGVRNEGLADLYLTHEKRGHRGVS